MPNIKSAKKRVEIGKQKRAINKSYKSELATAMKKYVKAVQAGDKELASKLLPETFAILDKNVARNIIHKNKANRKKAEFSTMLQKMTVSVKEAPAKEEAVKTVEPAKEEVKETAKKKATKKTDAKVEEPAKKTAKRTTKKAEDTAEKKTTAKKTTKKAE